MLTARFEYCCESAEEYISDQWGGVNSYDADDYTEVGEDDASAKPNVMREDDESA